MRIFRLALAITVISLFVVAVSAFWCGAIRQADNVEQ